MDISGVLGGLWCDREGYVDTTGTVHAYAGAAKKRGGWNLPDCFWFELILKKTENTCSLKGCAINDYSILFLNL